MRSVSEPVSLTEKDLAGVKEEDDIKIDKNFEIRDIDPDLLWQTKVALFETRFDDAEKLLSEPSTYNLWAMSVHTEGAVTRYMLEKLPGQLETAVTRLRTAAAQAVVLIKRYKIKPEKKALAKDIEKSKLLCEAMAHEAHAYMILAAVLLVSGSYVKGAYYTRKSWKCWEATNKVLQTLEELGAAASEQLSAFCAFGVGFFYFGISLVPENMEFLVKILGFKGDRLKAAELLQHSKQVRECGKSIESSLMLYALRLWFADERETAPELLTELQAELPNAPLILFMQGWQAMITDHDSDKAIECYRQCAELVKFEQLRVVMEQSLSWAHYVREDWEDVAKLLKSYLETKAKPGENHSYSSFNLALACYMLGRRDECKDLMQKVCDYEKKSNNWDSYAANVARRYLEQDDFDRCTLLLTLADNANEAGFPERTLKYLAEAETLPWHGFGEDDKLAMIFYYRGVALRLKKDISGAKSSLIRAAGMHHKTLKLEARRAIPYSLVVLGEISMRDLDQTSSNFDAAARFFSKAQQYKEKYLFAEILQFRMKSDTEVLADKRPKLALNPPAEENFEYL